VEEQERDFDLLALAQPFHSILSVAIDMQPQYSPIVTQSHASQATASSFPHPPSPSP